MTWKWKLNLNKIVTWDDKVRKVKLYIFFKDVHKKVTKILSNWNVKAFFTIII